MRSHAVLKGLKDTQAILKTYGGMVATGMPWLAPMLPGEYGEKVAKLQPYMVDNSQAVIIDIREALHVIFKFSQTEVSELMSCKDEFSVRVSGDDIRIFEYPDELLGDKPDALREDYRRVKAGGTSQLDIDYNAVIPCTDEVALSRVLDILFAYSDPEYVKAALRGNMEAFKGDLSVSAKVTLMCMRESLTMLEEYRGDVFWEVWPGHKEKWPYSRDDTQPAIKYLQRYFNLLIQGELEQARLSYLGMGLVFGVNALIKFNMPQSVASQKMDEAGSPLQEVDLMSRMSTLTVFDTSKSETSEKMEENAGSKV
ncbi:hypothetical protein [Sansalvadorimonas verongulae]|uniref:hypothetical protein n=1 Tax=Sansalvadorimonas verongulae TaxID=2172824 RepID=UPI0012BCA273|nr:hypothetical protein [Sansalvadorimonas verongulae]MTI12698.1 hypothetical protein [Sansalvadorimonas verongulae]